MNHTINKKIRSGWITNTSVSDHAHKKYTSLFAHVSIADKKVVQEIGKDKVAVILPPIGPEYMHCYRTLKQSAITLSDNGFDAIRVDYPGYGNSDEGGEHLFNLESCLNALENLIAQLKQENPHKKIAVIALRSASLLASELIKHIEIDTLIYWYPYVSGAAFVRDMQLVDAELNLHTTDTFVEAGGYPKTLKDCAKLKEIKLTSSDHYKVKRCLILANGEQKTNQRLLSTLKEKNIKSEQIECLGLAAMARQAELSVVPHQNLNDIVNWLLTVSESSTYASNVSISPYLNSNTFSENIILSKEEPNNLPFSILTLPSNIADISHCDKVVVIGNAGSGHHVGPNRLHVLLARALAAKNIATIRYDLNGLGESKIQKDAHPYPADALESISNLLHWLVSCHVKQVNLVGLCSGAYHCFQMARSNRKILNNITIESINLINPLFFYWKPGESIFAPQSHAQEISKNYYASQAKDYKKWIAVVLNPKKWWNIFSFVLRFGLKKLSAVFSRAYHLFVKKPRTKLSKDISSILDKGTNVNMFMAEGEAGLIVINSQLDEIVKKHKHFSCTVFSQTDHTFSSRNAREKLIRKLVEAYTHEAS